MHANRERVAKAENSSDATQLVCGRSRITAIGCREDRSFSARYRDDDDNDNDNDCSFGFPVGAHKKIISSQCVVRRSNCSPSMIYYWNRYPSTMAPSRSNNALFLNHWLQVRNAKKTRTLLLIIVLPVLLCSRIDLRRNYFDDNAGKRGCGWATR